MLEKEREQQEEKMHREEQEKLNCQEEERLQQPEQEEKWERQVQQEPFVSHSEEQIKLVVNRFLFSDRSHLEFQKEPIKSSWYNRRRSRSLRRKNKNSRWIRKRRKRNRQCLWSCRRNWQCHWRSGQTSQCLWRSCRKRRCLRSSKGNRSVRRKNQCFKRRRSNLLWSVPSKKGVSEVFCPVIQRLLTQSCVINNRSSCVMVLNSVPVSF